MNDNPMTFAEFSESLRKRGFSHHGASTFWLNSKNETDVISVWTNGSIVIITHDGKKVRRNFKIIQVLENPDCFFWDSVLQDVLACF